VTGAADALAGHDAHAVALQIREFRLDVSGHAGKAIGRVVDQNVYFQPTHCLKTGHATPRISAAKNRARDHRA